jgi:hypothetical protein
VHREKESQRVGQCVSLRQSTAVPIQVPEIKSAGVTSKLDLNSVAHIATLGFVHIL